jgi:hypothetical protein
VGYYVQMAGLGKRADAVKFTGTKSGPFVPALNKHFASADYGTIPRDGAGLILDTFWRAAENFYTNTSSPLMWAVSQAAPLRSVHVAGDLQFGDADAFASGGFLANALVEGATNFVAQQQWYSRHVDFRGEVEGGAWNLVFTGCEGRVPEPGMRNLFPGDDMAFTVENTPEVRVEKPFITLTGDDKWELVVPELTRDFVRGPDLGDNRGDARDFANVKVGTPREDEKDADDIVDYNTLDATDAMITADLQAALNDGKDVVLSPGTYFLTRSLVVETPNQVVLGLGLATLIAPQDGSPCIRVKANTAGVRIAGVMLEASMQIENTTSSGTVNSTRNADGRRSLLEFGEPGVLDAGDARNPGVLTDVFARVGGTNLNRDDVKTDVIIRVHSGNVVGDNLWLWRADHVKLDTRNGEEPNDPSLPLYHQSREGEVDLKNAIEVRGDDVKMYGLFSEHAMEHQTVWSGERGSTSFYQCELPYDVSPGNFKDFVGYKVDDAVDAHGFRGGGVYSNFKVFNVVAERGFEHPEKDGIFFENPFTVFLDGLEESGIAKVINESGGPVQYQGGGSDISRPLSTDPPAPACTPEWTDPYISGPYVECCAGLAACVNDWGGNGNWFFLCAAPEECPTAV